MSILEYMIINDKGKQHKYMINTQVAIHVQEQTCEHILKQFPPDADIHFEKII
jgi:hypothetical protein